MSRFAAFVLSLSLCVYGLSGCAGGSGSGSGSQPQPQPQPTNMIPSISSVSPASLEAGSASQTITVTGSNFVSASVVVFNGTSLPTTFVSATSLQASVPATAIVAGQVATITVSGPTGTALAAPASYPVTAPSAQVTSVSPAGVLQATGGTITVTGSGFEANSVVIWNGKAETTVFVNTTTLQATIPGADAQTAGAAAVAVNNPGPSSSTSAAASVAVYPPPVITGVTPATVPFGASDVQIAVTGTGFAAGATLTLDGTVLPVTMTSATTLQATVSASLLQQARTANLAVHNPSPNAADSAAFPFNVSADALLVTALYPSAVPTGQATSVTVDGYDFSTDVMVQLNGVAKPTYYRSSGELTVMLSAADLQNAGNAQITVNSPVSSQTSNALILVVAVPPTVSAVTPTTVKLPVPASNLPTITVTGSGFHNDAYITVNGTPLTTTSVTSTQISATVPSSSFFYTAGPMQVAVNNPTNGYVIQSGAATLNVINPSAAFSVMPNAVPAGSPDTKITVYGNAFFADSVVQWNGIPLPTTVDSFRDLSVTIPAAWLAAPSTATITVNTPENGGAATPTAGFAAYLGIPVNGLAWNAKDNLLYATVSGTAGAPLGNSLVGIDPTTGVVKKTIFVGSEPNRLAISTDGTQAFVGLDGAGAVRQVSLTTNTAGVQWVLGGGAGIYNTPYTATSLAAVPGEPNSVAVLATNSAVTIYDSGIARPKTSSGQQAVFNASFGGLTFGPSASTLYVAPSPYSNSLYVLTIDSTGVASSKALPTAGHGQTLQYDNGALYFPNGVVADASTGDSLGQLSYASSDAGGGTVSAAGPVVSDSTLHRAWVVGPTNYSSQPALLTYDTTTFNLLTSIPLGSDPSTVTSILNGTPELVRWGQNGLAYHLGHALFLVQGAMVKDTSGEPVDVQVSASAPTGAMTGSAFDTSFVVSNAGANEAQNVVLTATLPDSVLYTSVKTTPGTCTGQGTVYCTIGSLSPKGSATVTLTGTPTVAGAVQVTAIATTTSYDSVPVNNSATTNTAVTGTLYSGVPTASTVSPNLVQSGSGTFTLTVTGKNFTAASAVNWNGTALPTTLVSGTSLTASVDASLIKQLGWGTVTVTNAAPGGGSSGGLTVSVYDLLDVPANAMTYDPFTRKLYAVLPSTSTKLTGNSLVSVDPATGTIGTPIVVGSEPNKLAVTSRGNYIYLGLSGANSFGRFNMNTQQVDVTVPLSTTGAFGGPVAANAVVTIPGLESSVAIPNVGIFDISGANATERPNSVLTYADAVFTDSAHAYTFDSYSSGALFYRFTVDASGVHARDGKNGMFDMNYGYDLLGMGGFNGAFAIEDGIGYGNAGGIFDPDSTPPTQIAALPAAGGAYGVNLSWGGVVPYPAEHKDFEVGVNLAGFSQNYVLRYDTQQLVLEDSIPLPGNSFAQTTPGVRWGQDGLAYLLSSGVFANAPAQIIVMRGPFVLPAESIANAAPKLTAIGSGTVAASAGNQRVQVTGTAFLPGASVVWNGVEHDTKFVDAKTLFVAVGAKELIGGKDATVTVKNPGSAASNALTVKVQ